MTIPSAPVPPAGNVEVGSLLADAQTRTLWLGVPASINAAQSVLISDLVGLVQADTDTLTAAKAYTDTGLTGKSNTGHHHPTSDIDGLGALIALASGVPAGVICLWSGTIVTIPAGWVICDGANGTPDLREKFVMGAGGVNYNQGASGGSANRTLATSAAGAHDHGGVTANTTLTITQIPGHTHGVTDPGHIHTVSDPGHTHAVWVRNQARMDSSSSAYVPGSGAGGTLTNSAGVEDANTGISVNSRTTGISIQSAGSGGAHNHVLTGAVDHTHNIATFSVLPPYFVLAYIMKLP